MGQLKNIFHSIDPPILIVFSIDIYRCSPAVLTALLHFCFISLLLSSSSRITAKPVSPTSDHRIFLALPESLLPVVIFSTKNLHFYCTC